jgi:hypothetical protein
MSVVIEEAGEGNRIEVGETVTWTCAADLDEDPADPALRSFLFLQRPSNISKLHSTSSCDTLKHYKFTLLLEYRCHANDPMSFQQSQRSTFRGSSRTLYLF